MLTLRNIMTHDVLSLPPDISIRDAMDMLIARKVGGAPVVVGSTVVGVVSMTDIIQFASTLADQRSDHRQDREWFAAGSDRREEREWLAAGNSEPPPDADGDAGSVFFTELWDDTNAEVVDQFESPSRGDWNGLGEHTVSEIMTREVRSLPPGTDVAQAAGVMTSAGIHRILVMDGGRLVGIVSLTDIAKAAAEHKLSVRTYVFDHPAGFHDRAL
jgi:CBS domain-containing protein